MEQAIQDFLAGRRIALVGASRNPEKFGHKVFLELAARGYEMVPVHPEAIKIAGVSCSPDLYSIEGTLDGVLVMVPAARVSGVLRDTAAIGVKNVWLQRGVESAEALALAQELGLNVVAKKCILMYAPPVAGFHKFHRTISRLVGKL